MTDAALKTEDWGDANRPMWRTLCREIVLTAVKLAELEARAARLSEECPDPFAVKLPLANLVGGRSVTEMPLGELTAAAVAQGVVTADEIKKARALALDPPKKSTSP